MGEVVITRKRIERHGTGRHGAWSWRYYARSDQKVFHPNFRDGQPTEEGRWLPWQTDGTAADVRRAAKRHADQHGLTVRDTTKEGAN